MKYRSTRTPVDRADPVRVRLRWLALHFRPTPADFPKTNKRGSASTESSPRLCGRRFRAPEQGRVGKGLAPAWDRELPLLKSELLPARPAMLAPACDHCVRDPDFPVLH